MSAAALREARRQRILNNMDGRLKKITTLPGAVAEDTNNVDHPIFPSSHQNANYNEFSNSGPLDEEPESEVFCPSQKNEEPSNLNLPGESKEAVTKKHFAIRLMCHKYLHIILIALTSYLLLQYQYGFLIYNSAMVPFYTYAAVQCTIFGQDQNAGMVGMLMAVLGMYGFSSRLLSVMTQVVTIAVGLAHDLCIFMFFFVLFTSVFGV